MGDIYKSSYTSPMPPDAVVKGQTVQWTDKRGKRKTGKRTGSDRVLIETGKWIARWTDETGREHKESTGCTSKDAALHYLRNKELEVERIRAGLMTRDEIDKTAQRLIPIADHLDVFDLYRKADNISEGQITNVRKKLNEIFGLFEVKSLADIKTDQIIDYIVLRQKNGMATQTINNNLSALRSFFTWCVATDRMTISPMRNIKQLSRVAGKKTERRAFTEEELTRFFETVRLRRGRGQDNRNERELIYLTMLGTGLRSSELASIKVSQVTPTHIILESPDEKNRKGTYQPMTEKLSVKLFEWIALTEKTPNDFLFKFTKHSIFGYFKRDCKAAGIKRVDDRGHVLVVHSFRKTFGTRLARAGVPLTTTQRLMRHSTPELTARYYIDVTPIDLLDALQKIKSMD
jgi:integrase